MNKIERIKATLREHIAEAEKATPGPWEVYDDGISIRSTTALNGYIGGTSGNAKANAAFIAQARTMDPNACKGLLVAIESHQLVMSYRHQGSFDTSKQALAEIEAAFPEI